MGKTIESPRHVTAAARPRGPHSNAVPLAAGRDRSVVGAGLMSGTSADGIDAALVRFTPGREGLRLKLLGYRTHPYPRGFRDVLLRNSHPGTARLDEIARLNMLVAEFFSEAVESLAGSLGVPMRRIGFIGSHGQTICHLPDPEPMFGRKVRATLQIGHPSLIAKRTGITTVGDFRVGDVAVGGAGAPLVPICDHLLYGGAGVNRAVLNIGGIANITILPRRGRAPVTRAFDTGPGNMPSDLLASRLFGIPWDRDGAIASSGSILPGLLRSLAAHPFIRRTPPKSTGREDFGKSFVDRILREARGARKEDVMATVAEFTALAVYSNCLLHVPRRHFPAELTVSGGGVHNRRILDSLRRYFSPAPVRVSDDTGLPADAKEAFCFALLAWRTLHGSAGNLPAVTGALRPTPLGVICPP